MKRLFLLLFIFTYSTSILFAKNIINDINTTLVIIDEQENGEFVSENTPVADGIFEALWDMENLIFFDMKINKPIPLTFEQLDVKPYINAATESGADSILLIKFHYFTNKEGEKIRLKVEKVFYNFYSLKKLGTLSAGEKNLKLNKLIFKDNKTQLLKKLGSNLLSDICH